MNLFNSAIVYLQKHIWESALIALCVVLLVSHSLYVLQTHQYPQGGLDEPVYLESALSMYDLLKEDAFGNWQNILRTTVNRQPFYPLFIALPLLIFGTEHLYKIGLWLNSIYYLITIVSIYAIGRKFLHKRSSFLAAYMFAFYGFPLFYLHFTYSETAVTAFTAAAVAYLARTDGFTKGTSVIGFSILFAASSLVRWVAPLFVIGPFLTEVCTGIFHNVKRWKTHVIRLSICLAIGLVCGILPALYLHYLPQSDYLFGYVNSNTSNSGKWAEQYLGIPSMQSVFSMRSIMFYLNILSQQGIYFWVVFVAGFLVSVRHVRKYIFLLAGFIVPYAIFTFGSAWKGDRFILPIYPFMALLSAVIFDHIPSVWLRRVLVVITIIMGLLNFFGASWGMGPLGQQGLKDIVLPEFIHHPRRVYLTTMVWPPRPNEANIDAITSLIRSDWKNGDRQPVIALGFFLPQMENGLGEVWGRERRGSASLVFLYNVRKSETEIFLKNVAQADYILVKDGAVDGKEVYTETQLSDDGYYFVHLLRQWFQKTGAWVPEGYIEVGKIPIPIDRSTMTVFKKTSVVTTEHWAAFLNEIGP